MSTPSEELGLQRARQSGWPMEGAGGEAQAVGAPASWLFQAVSSPHRHQACLEDQGHRKGGSFPVFLLFLCKPLFWLSTLPNEEENEKIWLESMMALEDLSLEKILNENFED